MVGAATITFIEVCLSLERLLSKQAQYTREHLPREQVLKRSPIFSAARCRGEVRVPS
jgi:hypothetical protein